MGALRMQFGEGFACRCYNDREARDIQRNLDQLHFALSDGEDVLVLFFEYMGSDGYGYGIFYTPFARSDGPSEYDEALLFIADPSTNRALIAAKKALKMMVKDLNLHHMPIVTTYES